MPLDEESARTPGAPAGTLARPGDGETFESLAPATGAVVGVFPVHDAAAGGASVPAQPFGGVGESGFGRVHGADGLREFTRAKAVTRERAPLPVDFMSSGRPAGATEPISSLSAPKAVRWPPPRR
ncbi:aldehyde dehydrogenase family protein [Modestobacter sp. SYSU DS0657]